MATAITVFTATFVALIAATWKSRTLATDTRDRHDTRVKLGTEAAKIRALEELGVLYDSVARLGWPVTSPSVDPDAFVPHVEIFLGALSDAGRLQAAYQHLLAACRALSLLLIAMVPASLLSFLRASSLWGVWDDGWSIVTYVMSGVVVAATALCGSAILVLEQQVPDKASKYSLETDDAR